MLRELSGRPISAVLRGYPANNTGSGTVGLDGYSLSPENLASRSTLDTLTIMSVWGNNIIVCVLENAVEISTFVEGRESSNNYHILNLESF